MTIELLPEGTPATPPSPGGAAEAASDRATTRPAGRDGPRPAPARRTSEPARWLHRTSKKPSRRTSWIIRAANVVLAAMCFLTSAMVVGTTAGWWRIETVLSGSMRPTIQPGTIEILCPEPTASLRVGQVVAFHPPHDGFTVTHRVVAITHHHGTWMTTKGDANQTTDPWGRVRIKGTSVWVVRATFPGAGYVNELIRTPWLSLLLLLMVVGLACAIGLERIWRT